MILAFIVWLIFNSFQYNHLNQWHFMGILEITAGFKVTEKGVILEIAV